MERCETCFDLLDAANLCAWCSTDPPETWPTILPIGATIEGRYRIGRVLGRGGFGVTYLGWQRLPGRRVAIKEYFPQDIAARRSDGTTIGTIRVAMEDAYNHGLSRFRDEAQRLSTFHGNANIVSVFDFVESNGTAYMIMDYCVGQSAQSYLTARGGRLDFDEALDIMRPVLHALEVVHAEGIYHRDISPDNILLTDAGVKLIDFGAAREDHVGASQSFSVVLRRSYAPPEQYSRRGRQGPWTDVYAAAATLYHMVTGSPPIEAMERMQGVALDPPTALGAVIPGDAEGALMKALSIDASQRPQSASQFLQLLEAGAPPPFVERRTSRPGSRWHGPERRRQLPPPSETHTVRGATGRSAAWIVGAWLSLTASWGFLYFLIDLGLQSTWFYDLSASFGGPAFLVKGAWLLSGVPVVLVVSVALRKQQARWTRVGIAAACWIACGSVTGLLVQDSVDLASRQLPIQMLITVGLAGVSTSLAASGARSVGRAAAVGLSYVLGAVVTSIALAPSPDTWFTGWTLFAPLTIFGLLLGCFGHAALAFVLSTVTDTASPSTATRTP